MKNKKAQRLRRARKVRNRIRLQRKYRLCVFRSSKHIYAQVITHDGSRTLTSASSLEPELRNQLQTTGGIESARMVGRRVAERALNMNVDTMAFDRSGHRYHGRVKTLAEAAREAGITI